MLLCVNLCFLYVVIMFSYVLTYSVCVLVTHTDVVPSVLICVNSNTHDIVL